MRRRVLLEGLMPIMLLLLLTTLAESRVTTPVEAAPLNFWNKHGPVNYYYMISSVALAVLTSLAPRYLFFDFLGGNSSGGNVSEQHYAQPTEPTTTIDAELFQAMVEQMEHSNKALEAKLNTVTLQLTQELENLKQSKVAEEKDEGSFDGSFTKTCDNDNNNNNDHSDNLLIRQQLERLEHQMMHSQKMENLAWAIEHAGKRTFTYFVLDHHHRDGGHVLKKNSQNLVEGILLNFRRNYFYQLPDGFIPSSDSGEVQKINNKGRKRFRDALASNIHRLTGVKPWIEFDHQRDANLIYYSQ